MEIVTWINSNWGTILSVCGVLGIGLEISPAKVRPISAILKFIAEALYSPVDKKIDALQTEFRTFVKDYDMGKIRNLRAEIIGFSISCQRDEQHTQEDFNRIFEQTDHYHALLEQYNMTNGKIDIEVAYINKVYKDCLAKGKFFKG